MEKGKTMSDYIEEIEVATKEDKSEALMKQICELEYKVDSLERKCRSYKEIIIKQAARMEGIIL